MQVIEVVLFTTTLVAATPPTLTVAPGAKLVPVRVTDGAAPEVVDVELSDERVGVLL